MPLEKLNELFDKQQKKWAVNLNTLIDMLDDIREIPKAQIYMLKYRHDITELISTYQVKNNQLQTEILNRKKARLEHYKSKTQIALNSFGEYETVINGDISDILSKQTAIKIQIDYLQEVRQTIDKVGFSIKNRISLHNESGI